jgi:protein tyrosine phosphatase
MVCPPYRSPQDISRVKLDAAADYINANHISTQHIAAQGPLPHTTHAFWSMIFTLKSLLIVNLINKDEPAVKCSKYWEFQGILTDAAGTPTDMSVELISSSQAGALITRKFRLTRDETEHCVSMLHFTEWPDFGVPAIGKITDIVLESHKILADADGPIIVHCSAGVGRTGVWIAADCLIRERLDRDDKSVSVNEVVGVVDGMRMKRSAMVQVCWVVRN